MAGITLVAGSAAIVVAALAVLHTVWPRRPLVSLEKVRVHDGNAARMSRPGGNGR